MNFRIAVILIVALGAMFASTTAASAWWWRDRTPPTAPSNLEVTEEGSDYVALSWDASFDRSFSFSYRVYRSGQSQPVTVPSSQTSYVWDGLDSGETYSFYVTAVDASGNVSNASNTVEGSTTTGGNDMPPSAPGQVFVTDRTSTSISLWWYAATDDVGVSSYNVFVDEGAPASVTSTGATSARVSDLDPDTTYQFDVVAVDTSGQEGPPSSVAGTTLGTVDVTPPSAPSSLDVAADVGCGNFFLDWTESRDDFDHQTFIRYDVYMDDGTEPVGSITGDYFIELHVDIEPNSTHSFYLIAVDTSGNESAPSNVDSDTDTCTE